MNEVLQLQILLGSDRLCKRFPPGETLKSNLAFTVSLRPRGYRRGYHMKEH